MRLIKPYCEILPQAPGLEGVYKQIEIAGRTCYKSEDKMTESSAEDFVNRMIKSGHGAMLEHGTVYLTVPGESEPDEIGQCSYVPIEKGNYSMNAYSKREFEHFDQKPNEVQSEFCKVIPRTRKHITTNLRVLVENGWLDDLKYICEPTEYHQRRVTVRFVCDRGVSHELVRHRVFSFAQESTRYCNYSKDKFGNEITYIIPLFINLEEGTYNWTSFNYGDITHWCGWKKREEPTSVELNSSLGKEISSRQQYHWFLKALEDCETSYFYLLNEGKTPQQARQILPNALKTEIVVTGFVDDWKHFFKLRCDKAAHPDMQYLANSLKEQFIENGIPTE